MAIDTTIALTTLGNARTHLQIPTGRTENDSKIERLINAASQYAARYCDRIFLAASYTEYFDGRKQNMLMPRQWPINSIASLRISIDRDWASAQSLVPITDYEITDNGLTVAYYGHLPRGRKCVQMVSNCGYASIPYDLEQVILQLIEWWYRHNERQDIGRTSSSKSDESVGVLAEVPKHILQGLAPFKRMEFPSSYLPVGNE